MRIVYKIKYEEGIFISALDIVVPQAFMEEFRFNKENIDIFSSEASRSELIISPLLREIYIKDTVKIIRFGYKNQYHSMKYYPEHLTIFFQKDQH